MARDGRGRAPLLHRDRSRFGHTGRFLVLLEDEVAPQAVSLLRDGAGMRVASTAEGATPAEVEERADVDGTFFHRLGVAVVRAEPDQVRALARRDAGAGQVVVERERYVAISDAVEGGAGAAGDPRRFREQPYYQGDPERFREQPYYQGDPDRFREQPYYQGEPGGVSREYLRGFRDAAQSLFAATTGSAGAAAAEVPPPDESALTWGLQAIGADRSSLSGRGVRVAVLDCGFDTAHPDFSDRSVTSRSFVTGAPGDRHGHGTHCIGTACGPRQPEILPGYGVAPATEIYAAKVLDDEGWGRDEGILQGIQWAVENGCRVVSLSLGSPTKAGERFSPSFERAAQRALAAGTLIVSAAGNDSCRDDDSIMPVAHPANCPSILAVAALDHAMQVAFFSNRGVNPDGGQVDVAAPGVDVYSSWPVPDRYRVVSGTSMATPHAAGVAALLAEAHPDASAGELFGLLGRTARRLPLASADVGAGLVQAP